jgi:hypothetical protein
VHVFWVGKRFLVFWTAGTTCPVTQCHWASGSWCSQQPALPAQWHNAIGRAVPGVLNSQHYLPSDTMPLGEQFLVFSTASTDRKSVV